MYLLDVDESGDTGHKGSRHLILAGAALFEGKWRWVRSDLDNLLARYFPAPGDRPRELHAAELRKGRGHFSRLTPAERAAMLTDACGVLKKLSAREIALFAIVVDKRWWFHRNPAGTGSDLYLAAFEELVSRFDYYLKRRHRQGQSAKGLIIADPRHEAFSRALRAAVRRFQDVGTQWARLENIVESVLFLESHESPGIQVADLTSYAVRRAAERADTGLAAQLKYHFDREDSLTAPQRVKWHGVRYHGPLNAPARAALRPVWAGV